MTDAYIGIGGIYEQYTDFAAISRLVQKLPADRPVPRTHFVLVLSPEAPAKRLDPADPRTLAESALPILYSDSSRCTFILSPSPGKEFASIEVTADAEQAELGHGPLVRCSAKTPGPYAADLPLGSVDWPPARGPGHQIIRRRFEVPPGAGLLYLEVRQAKGKATVRSVEATGEFRPRQDAVPVAPALVHADANPQGGILTCNGAPLPTTREAQEMEPGRYDFDYRIGGDARRFHCQADLVSGARYALTASLNSPFEWHSTNLRGVRDDLDAPTSLARMPDGRWILAYGGRDRKVHLSISQDLLKWEEPWLLPHEAIFESAGPTLYVGEGGTVWLAYFGNRASWNTGFRIWLTRSRDGRTWTPPRPVLAPAPSPRPVTWRDYFELGGGAPHGAIQMLRGPDGRAWIAWEYYVGSADSPDHFPELEQVSMEGLPPGGMVDARRTIGADGLVHQVFRSDSKAIYHRTSPDGQNWSPPVPIIQWPEAPNKRFRQPQLVLDGNRAAVLYGCNNGLTWLSRGTLGPPARFDPPIEVVNWMTPLSGSQAHVTPDGQVLLLAGKDTVWLLRTTLSRLTRPSQEF
jgi:hypothetical protein